VWTDVDDDAWMFVVECDGRLLRQRSAWRSLAEVTQAVWRTLRSRMMICQLRMWLLVLLQQVMMIGFICDCLMVLPIFLRSWTLQLHCKILLFSWCIVVYLSVVCLFPSLMQRDKSIDIVCCITAIHWGSNKLLNLMLALLTFLLLKSWLSGMC